MVNQREQNEKARSTGQPMTSVEQALRAEKNKAGKLRFELEQKADRLEYARGKRTD